MTSLEKMLVKKWDNITCEMKQLNTCLYTYLCIVYKCVFVFMLEKHEVYDVQKFNLVCQNHNFVFILKYWLNLWIFSRYLVEDFIWEFVK